MPGIFFSKNSGLQKTYCVYPVFLKAWLVSTHLETIKTKQCKNTPKIGKINWVSNRHVTKKNFFPVSRKNSSARACMVFLGGAVLILKNCIFKKRYTVKRRIQEPNTPYSYLLRVPLSHKSARQLLKPMTGKN
jgi:hypothetical protein